MTVLSFTYHLQPDITMTKSQDRKNVETFSWVTTVVTHFSESYEMSLTKSTIFQ